MHKNLIKKLLVGVDIILLLFLITLLALRSSYVQNIIKSKVLASFSKQYDADFSIGHIYVNGFDKASLDHILLRDQKGDTLLYADHINVDIGLFSLFDKQIWLDEVEITHVRSKIYDIGQDSMNFTFLIPAKDTVQVDTTATKWKFGVTDIIINQPNIRYKTSSQQFDFQDEKLIIKFDQFDLEKRFLEVDLLETCDLSVLLKTLKQEESSQPFSLPNLDWNFKLNEITINKANIQTIGLKDTLYISKVSAQLEKTQFYKGKFTTHLRELSGNYNNLIALSEAQATLSLDSLMAAVEKFDFKTSTDKASIDLANYSFVNNELNLNDINLDLSYPTIKLLESYIPKNIRIQQNTPLLFKADHLFFQPSNLRATNTDLVYGNVIKTRADFKIDQLRETNKGIEVDIKNIETNLAALDNLLVDLSIPNDYKMYKNVRGSARANGNFNRLNIQMLDLEVDKDIKLKTNGFVNNLSDPERLHFNLNVSEFKAPAKRIPIPPNEKIAIDSLGQLRFNGSLAGNLNDLKINGLLKTNLGSLKSDIQLVIPKNIDNLAYKGTLMLQDFKLGTLIKNKEVGVVSFDVNLDGKGTALSVLNTKINGKISAATFRDYVYNDILIDAKISESTINGKLNLEDKNLKFGYDGQIILNDGYSIFNFDLKVDTLRTLELGLLDKPLFLSANIHSTFQIPISATQKSIIEIRDFNMSNPYQTFHADSIQLTGTKSLDTVFLKMNSTFGNLDMNGVYTLKDLPNAISAFIDHHWSKDSLATNTAFTSENLHIVGSISTIQPIAVYLQDSFLQAGNSTIDINTSFVDYSANGSIKIDSLLHNNIIIDEITAAVKTENEALNLDINSRNNFFNGRVVDLISLKNQIIDKKIISEFSARDGDDIPRMEFEWLTTQADEYFNISMKDSFILNQKDWMVNKANNIKIYPHSIFIDQFEITDKNEFLTVQSSQEGKDIHVNFKNFDVGEFATLLTSEPSKFTGKVNGDLDVKDINTDLYFITNLKIVDMVYDSTSVGELTIAANANPGSKVVTSNFNLIGPTNDVKGGGTFNTSNRVADFQVDLKSLDMLILNPFLSEIIVDSKGKVSGNAKLVGSLDKPSIKGVLTFDTVTTTVVANNARYEIDNHTITFDNNAIDIGSLKIKDDEGNIATLTGKIYHDFLEKINLDMALQTNKFTFLNTTSEENPVFFGKVTLDANGTIKGNPALLDVEVIAKTLKNSSITLSPFAGENLLIEEQFIAFGKPQDFEDLTSEYLLKLNRQYPFDVNLLINATKEAKFTFVIDPISGDKIQATGGGDLNVKLQPDGNQEIYGIYTVDEGTYNFSYGDFVSKKFKVKKGGTVKFEGNPLNAVLDIDAVYDVYTTTYELIKNEISISDSEAAAAKKRTTVKVYLSLKGTLDNPAITLNIEVPDLQSTNLVSAIDRKLQELRNNPNELNNQVFGLLIFDSFILTDNATSGFDNLGNNIALKSLSSLVSSQLNRLAGNVLKGVDINVNVNSYESGYVNANAGGNVTEVGLKVSKQLFNDRLSVSAGGNLDINQGATSGGYSSFIGDFVLNYKLTDDGRYQIKVFSKSDYDRLLNANTSRNGISIFFNQSFDSKTDAKK